MKVTSFIMGLGFIACFILQANAAIADDRHYDKNENFMIGAAVGGNDTWYVDGATGSDTTGDGSEASPWQTIGKALDRYRSALTMGDHIRIKAGVYNERLTIASLGGTASEQNRFVIGPYGDGEVIINPTDTHLLNWTAYNSTIYRTSYSFGTPDSIVMDDSFKSSRPVYALADCVADGQWYWDSAASMLYVHTSGQDPVTQRDILVRKLDENNTRFGIYVETEDYVTIYGLTILGAPSIGIYANGSHIKVEKCKIKYCGKNAITPGTFLEVNKCYLYANCMMNWPRGKRWGSNGGWPTAVNIGDGGSITGSIVAETGGEGINRYGGDSSAILIEDNIVYNNWSINIYVDNHPNATIRRNLIFCSGINFDDVIDVAHIPAGSTEETVRRRLRGTGIGLGDETQAHAVATSENHNIYNNIIIACRYGFDHYNQASGSGWKNFSIYNNLIILPDYDSALVNDTFYGFRVRNPGSNVATNIKNNIVIGNHSSGYLVDYLTSSQTDSGIIWDNNLWYHDNNALPFKYKTAAVNFTSWVGAVTNGDNSLNEDPQLEMTVFSNWSQQGYNEDTVSIADFHPQDTSPCFNGGEDLSSLFTTDYNSNLRSGWTIGAFENTNDAPSNLVAIVIPTESTVGYKALLEWVDNSNYEDGFKVERKVSGGSYALRDTVLANTEYYEDDLVESGSKYYYRVKAYNTSYESLYSNEISVVINEELFNTALANGGGQCFIATAAFGTPLEKDVLSLCKFRDNYLLNNEYGLKFVKLYYRLSPPIAGYIRSRRWAKALTRIFLRPIVVVVEKINDQ